MGWYARRAQAAGVELIWRRAFTGARRDAGMVTLDGGDLRSRYLIGADGAGSAGTAAIWSARKLNSRAYAGSMTACTSSSITASRRAISAG